MINAHTLLPALQDVLNLKTTQGLGVQVRRGGGSELVHRLVTIDGRPRCGVSYRWDNLAHCG